MEQARNILGTVTKVCKTCGNTFTLTAKEEKWFTDRNLKSPERCKSCRNKRRTIKKKKGGEKDG